MTRLIVGADVGGTSTRVAVADLSGAVLEIAVEAGGNPNAVGVEASAARIRTATERALTAVDGDVVDGDVVGVVLGMAGFQTVIAAGPDFVTAALPDRVTARPRIVSDLGVAYASGSVLPHGYVVIAGTGSGAAEIDRGDIVSRRGAWGWLLGDEGAGFWLGREAVRHALRETEAGVPPSDLTRQVIERLGIDPRRPLDGLVRVPYEQPPIRLAELAPLVTALLDSDPAAVSIAARSAETLADLLLDLDPRPGLPVVTAGSVLQSPGGIRELFTERVAASIGSPVTGATSGLVGALWLALCDLVDAPDPAVHTRWASALGPGSGGAIP